MCEAISGEKEMCYGDGRGSEIFLVTSKHANAHAVHVKKTDTTVRREVA